MLVCVNAARIQDNEVDSIGRRLLHAVDEFMFGITLETNQRMPERLGDIDAARLDIGKAVRPIDLGLA